MGAWGVGCFDNDDAVDWLNRIISAEDGLLEVEGALQAVVHDSAAEYVDAPEACEALVAAEVVAALCGSPARHLPPELIAWLSGKPVADNDTRGLAREAVEQIGIRSELRELWGESGELAEWFSVLRDLADRLQ